VPRAGLTEDRVVTEAERLADEVGLRQLTLAAVAERLGVRQPSLYKHIDNMDGLQRSIAVRARLELADVVGRAAIGRSRGDALRAVCHSYRTWALEHPGRYAATVRAPSPDDPEDLAATRAVVDVAFGVLSGYGLSGDDAVDATRTIRAALHGFLSLEAGGGFGLPQEVSHSFDRMVDALVAALDAGGFGRATVG
jgi:AcrR family transcriptional regulator